MSKLFPIASVLCLALSIGGCDYEAEGFEHDGESFLRVAPAGPASHTGGYQWTGSSLGVTEFFNLNGPNGGQCLSVPFAGFPNPAPTAGQECTATGCVPDPQFPNCEQCDKLTCKAAGGGEDADDAETADVY